MIISYGITRQWWKWLLQFIIIVEAQQILRWCLRDRRFHELKFWGYDLVVGVLMPIFIRVAPVTQFHSDIPRSNGGVIWQHFRVPGYPLPNDWVVSH